MRITATCCPRLCASRSAGWRATAGGPSAPKSRRRYSASGGWWASAWAFRRFRRICRRCWPSTRPSKPRPLRWRPATAAWPMPRWRCCCATGRRRYGRGWAGCWLACCRSPRPTAWVGAVPPRRSRPRCWRPCAAAVVWLASARACGHPNAAASSPNSPTPATAPSSSSINWGRRRGWRSSTARAGGGASAALASPVASPAARARWPGCWPSSRSCQFWMRMSMPGRRWRLAPPPPWRCWPAMASGCGAQPLQLPTASIVRPWVGLCSLSRASASGWSSCSIPWCASASRRSYGAWRPSRLCCW